MYITLYIYLSEFVSKAIIHFQQAVRTDVHTY